MSDIVKASSEQHVHLPEQATEPVQMMALIVRLCDRLLVHEETIIGTLIEHAGASIEGSSRLVKALTNAQIEALELRAALHEDKDNPSADIKRDAAGLLLDAAQGFMGMPREGGAGADPLSALKAQWAGLSDDQRAELLSALTGGGQ